MAWIESHTVLIRHRKIIALAAALNVRRSHAMGHVHALWHAALEQQEDGNLALWSDQTIAEMADFDGDPRLFVSLLKRRDINLLERDRRLHDWWDYAGPFLRSKYKRNSGRWERIRTMYVTVTGDVTSPPTIPNLTNQPNQPDHTLRQNVRASIEEEPKAGICDWKDRGIRCSLPREPRAFMCRGHIDKRKEVNAHKTEPRGGGWSKL